MQYGFIKVAAATPKIAVCDCKKNTEAILEIMAKAFYQKVQILVLPELCITGYTCGDFFFEKSLTDSALASLVSLSKASRGYNGLLTFVGLPIEKDGHLYNCAAAICGGNILGIVPKSVLPNYNEFFERRYFSPAPEKNDSITIEGIEYPFGAKLLFRAMAMHTFCVAAEICEDMWNPNPPSISHAHAGASIIVNLSASNETQGKDYIRRLLVASQSLRSKCGYVYASAGDGESTTDLVFSGHNIIAEDGNILAETKLFENGFAISEIDVESLWHERRKMGTFNQNKPVGYDEIRFEIPIVKNFLTRKYERLAFTSEFQSKTETSYDNILNIQVNALVKRIAHTNAKSIVVGVSGGLDSCLALLVAACAMDKMKRPRTDIIAVTMPCFGTTERTKNNAEKLSRLIGTSARCIDITASVKQHFHDIGHDPENTDIVYENSQARERTQILMDIANETGGFVLGTGDMSELALGWATYNGDHMSSYGINSGLPKTIVYRTVAHYACLAENEELNEVIDDIMDTPISPELLPSDNGKIQQKTEDVVGPYELHDFFLYYMLRYNFPPAKLYHVAKYAFQGSYEPAFIKKCLAYFYKRFFSQQFKRSCIPDGPKVFSISLSPRGDLKIPSDASAGVWMSELETIKD